MKIRIYVTVKAAGKRKTYITKQEVFIEETPYSLRALITEVVQINVETYNRELQGERIVDYLLPSQIDNLAYTGKVDFGEKQGEKLADLTNAIDTALLAFHDGLFRVFCNDEEITELDAPLEISEGSVLTFVRFTMLAGRMW